MKRMVWLVCICFVMSLLLCAGPVSAEEAAEAAEERPAYAGWILSVPGIGDRPMLADEGEDQELSWLFDDYVVTDDRDLALSMAADGTADSIEPNWLVYLDDTEADLQEDGAAEDSPADGWAWEAMHAGDPADLGVTGAGVSVAVLDSGVDLSNPALADAAAAGQITPVHDYVNGTDTAEDYSDYHGTRVIQTILGSADTAGTTGVAPGAHVFVYKLFDTNGTAKLSDIAVAIVRAAETEHCDIINMSFGLLQDSDTLHEAVARAYNDGTVLVAAAGNTSSFPQNSKVYPAFYDEVISVANVRQSDGTLAVSAGSVNNAGVDIALPGTNIPFIGSSYTVSPSYTLSYASGTSFSSPFAAGCIALLLEMKPDLKQSITETQTRASVDLVRTLFSERAVDLGEEGRDNASGWGFLDLQDMLDTVTSDSETGALTAEGWLPCGAGTRLIVTSCTAASGGDDGTTSWRMWSAAVSDTEGGIFQWQLRLSSGSPCLRIFFLNADGRPVREPVTVFITGTGAWVMDLSG